jgi:hypothetical protein
LFDYAVGDDYRWSVGDGHESFFIALGGNMHAFKPGTRKANPSG